jgi:hypothetical protein
MPMGREAVKKLNRGREKLFPLAGEGQIHAAKIGGRSREQYPLLPSAGRLLAKKSPRSLRPILWSWPFRREGAVAGRLIEPLRARPFFPI